MKRLAIAFAKLKLIEIQSMSAGVISELIVFDHSQAISCLSPWKLSLFISIANFKMKKEICFRKKKTIDNCDA